jgi:hypothetical protein
MKKEKRSSSPASQREAGKTDEKERLNPFREEDPKEIKEDELKEEASAEQKRKEALTERD